MNAMTNEHEPTSKYLEFLQWQLRTELRRGARFGEPAPRANRWAHGLRAAALIAVSLFAGAGVVIASEQVGDARRAERLLERNQIQLEVAERRVVAADEELARVKLLVESGHASTSALAAATLERAERERDAAHLRLQRDEIRAAGTSASSADAITAPKVGGRDFVAEHIRADLVVAKLEASTAAAAYERAEALAEAGFVSSRELDQARGEKAAAELGVARIEQRLALRGRFVAGEVDVATCEREALVIDAEWRRALATNQVAVLEKELEWARQAEAAGFASRVVAPLETRLEAARAEVRLHELELEELRGGE